MKFSRSQLILALASIVTLVLTWQAYQSDVSGTVMPTRVLSEKRDSRMSQQPAIASKLAVVERPLVPLAGDLFAKTYVKSKPKPVFKRVARSVPKRNVTPPIPPLPFKYIGRWSDKDKQAILLDYRGEVLMVKQGDVLAGQYRVEAIEETASHIRVKFLLMHLEKTQILQARVGQP